MRVDIFKESWDEDTIKGLKSFAMIVRLAEGFVAGHIAEAALYAERDGRMKEAGVGHVRKKDMSAPSSSEPPRKRPARGRTAAVAPVQATAPPIAHMMGDDEMWLSTELS